MVDSLVLDCIFNYYTNPENNIPHTYIEKKNTTQTAFCSASLLPTLNSANLQYNPVWETILQKKKIG